MDDQRIDRESGVGCLMSILAVIWAPYLIVKAYWIVLVWNNPDAAHGEISGPVRYFLLRLLSVAWIATAGVIVLRAAWYVWPRRKNKNPPH
jgi:hypothetical protein